MADKGKEYWQAQAALVRSGTLSPETKKLAMSHQLSQLGRAAYMDLYPEVFREFAPMTPSFPSWQELRIKDLSTLLRDYQGPEAAHIRWLIQDRMKDLQYQVRRQTTATLGRPPEGKPPPMPDWMLPYIGATTTEVKEGRGRRGERTKELPGELRPLGAQAELTPEQMAQMAGYQAWQKAGAPTKFSEGALRQMSDWQRHWTPYTRLSQSLFPKQQKLTPQWAFASQ